MLVADRIRKRVTKTDAQPGDFIGSEYELARQEKVARMTVRRAIELLINEGLIERRPGKGLYVRDRGVTTRMVQIIAGNLEWEPSLQVSRGAKSVAVEKGIQIQLYDAHGDLERDLDVMCQLPDSQAKGAIILSLHSAVFNEAVYGLKIKGFPFVLVDQKMQDIEVSSVTADNYGGGLQAGRALIAQGHQRIAFIGDLVATTVGERLAGLRDAMADAGLNFDRSLVLDLAEDKDRLGDWSGRIDQCTREAMGRPSPPTAIFFSCDAVARPAYRTLAGMGLRIPQDVSVVGFDDDPLAEWLTPGLSTLRQPFFEMGRVAMELLLKHMADPAAPAESRALPVTLVRRGSTAAVEAGGMEPVGAGVLEPVEAEAV